MMNFLGRYKEHLTRILLVFVIFSVGFAFGKHSVKIKAPKAGQSKGVEQVSSPGGDSMVRLYYMHATFRCVTCNSIEQQAKNLTEKEFANELSTRKIVWEEVNFQQNPALAAKFDVISSSIVVALIKDGQTVSFERLDQLYTLIETPDEFNAYVRAAINKALEQL